MDQNDENDFAAAVRLAFLKRNKALSRRGATVECTPVKEIVDGHESDVGRTDVRIAYRVQGARISLRLTAWGDRWVWVDARRSSKLGWAWESTSKGRFFAPDEARDLVARVEETLSACHLPVGDVPRAISAIWSECLAVEIPVV